MTIEMIFYIIDKEVNEMKQYLDMCQYILENGQDRDDRTGQGTRSVFGYQTRYDLTMVSFTYNKENVFKTYC